MKTIALPVVLLASLTVTGCTFSRNPLYSPEVANSQIDLSGVWHRYDPVFHRDEKLIITKNPGGGFSFRDVGTSTALDCQVVQLGLQLYLDFSIPSDSKSQPPAHAFSLLKIKDNAMALCQCNRDKLRQMLAKYGVANTTDWTGEYLSATTPELQKFFRDAGEDLFSFDRDHETYFRDDERADNGPKESL
jgi:hypothetical protein